MNAQTNALFVYVLLLDNNKFYVGCSKSPYSRIKTHFEGNGSSWTKKYKPQEIIEVIPNCDEYDEDKYTRKYMDRHGIDNVRGGSFSTIILDQNTIKLIKRQHIGTSGKCFICGEYGHFANLCPTKPIKKLDPILQNKGNKIIKQLTCMKCGDYHEDSHQIMCINAENLHSLIQKRELLNTIQNICLLKTINNGDSSITCMFCNKSFGKYKYLYYHCYYTCDFKDKIHEKMQNFMN